MPDWYLAELALGGVVEAYVAGDYWSSPSVQIEITPEGRVVVLATHEQILGGDNGQVYQGCHFPARRDYAMRLATYGQRVGRLLAERRVIGALSIDFAAARDHGQQWRLYALEVNLRRGGTTPPIVVLSSLLPGSYDAYGRWRLPDGSARYYCATDHVGDPRWTGLPPGQLIDGVRSAGLEFDRQTGTGVVLHMLSGIAIDGRFGMTAVGGSAQEAKHLFAAVRPVVNRLCAKWAASTAGYPGRLQGRTPSGSAAGARTRPQAAQTTDPVRMSLLIQPLANVATRVDTARAAALRSRPPRRAALRSSSRQLRVPRHPKSGKRGALPRRHKPQSSLRSLQPV